MAHALLPIRSANDSIGYDHYAALVEKGLYTRYLADKHAKVAHETNYSYFNSLMKAYTILGQKAGCIILVHLHIYLHELVHNSPHIPD